MATGTSNVTVTQQKYGPVGRNDLGINLGKPKYPDYAKLEKRKETFEKWKDYFPVRPDPLAEAGFMYIGSGDSCRCYHCGGGIRYWEEGDDPWVEHAKLYPNCDHVLLIKGTKYVDEYRKKENIKPEDSPPEDITNHMQTDAPGSDSIEALLKEVPALACAQMGCNETQIKQAIEIYRTQTGKTDFKGDELLFIMFEVEEKGFETVLADVKSKHDDSSQPIREDPIPEAMLQENERLKEKQMCRICTSSKACAIFLPCGHLLVCAQCAMALDKCPSCEAKIMATIKAYFGTDD